MANWLTSSPLRPNVSASLVQRSAGDPPKKVKNLGWLLRNWQKVESFTVLEHSLDRSDDVVLVAHLQDGGKYQTGFASREVLWRFLNRPVFEGLAVNWLGEPLLLAKAWRQRDLAARAYQRQKKAKAP